MNWKFWKKTTPFPDTIRIRQILVPQTHRYSTDGEGRILNHMNCEIHSRYIDVGRQDISIIPPDDMP